MSNPCSCPDAPLGRHLDGCPHMAKLVEHAKNFTRRCRCGAEIPFPESACWVACAACRGGR